MMIFQLWILIWYYIYPFSFEFSIGTGDAGFFSISTFNIALKQTLVKLRLTCNEHFFFSLNFKTKLMLQSCRMYLKQVLFFSPLPLFPLNHYFTMNQIHLRIQTFFKGDGFNILINLIWNILWLIWMLFTVINKKFRKYSNLSKIGFIY